MNKVRPSRFWSPVRLIGQFSGAKKAGPFQDGFALIEVLISLAIVGVISSLMIVFLGQARAIMRIESATEFAMEVDAAVQFLEDAITKAEPLPLQSAPTTDQLFFRGNASHLEFTGVQAIGFGTSALREIAVTFAPANPLEGRSSGTVLLLQSKRRQGTDRQTPDEPITLLEGATDLSFEFLDRDGKSWIKEWNLSRRLPRAVRFRISIIRDGMTYSSQGVTRLALAFY